MDTLHHVTIGMTAEKTVTVTTEMTVGHFVTHMPQVYATPIMILHMEMASGSAIASHLPEGFVSVGMDVKVRHLAATPVGRTVRAISRVIKIDPKSVVFEVEAWDGDRKIGDGTHRRGIVNALAFEKRFGVFTHMRTSKPVETASHPRCSAAEPSNIPVERVD
jgi:fluoroacetyl-CoA thioesterase